MIKKQFFTKVILVLIIFSFSLQAFGAEKEKIFWARVDAPPYFFCDGALKNTGIGDNIISTLIKNMPEYNHEVLNGVPVSRIEIMMQSGENVCFVLAFKNADREKFMTFSNATSVNPAYAIITTEDKKAKLTTGNSISLEALLKNSKLNFGVADRAYGSVLDPVISKYKNNKNVYIKTGANIFTELLTMLEEGRVDYIIGLPYELKYISKINNKEIKKIKTLEIEEIKNEKLMYAYAGLPKNEWGEKLKTRINGILDRERKQKEYFEIFSEWMDDESIKRTKKEWESKIESEKTK